MSALEIKGQQFILDDKPIQIISGSLHYVRIVPEYWKDRLLKAKALGLNCIETYVAWNIHEPEEGQFNFEGIADIERFIKIVDELDMKLILRPAPYMCAEWDFGGMPYWLLKDKDIKLRCYSKPFLDKIDRYYDELIPRIVPFLSTNGGPIIAVQIENEYGSYGNDKKYLAYMKEALIKRGVDVLLCTSDGPEDLMLWGGKVDDEVLQTANFGSRPKESFEVLKKHQPNKPIMCMEYWNGWFDHWEEEHHVRGYEDAAQCLDDMLKMGASLNLYMVHGGTNFGFYNGANYELSQSLYQPTVTSYDYDCPISEYGEITPKYLAFKEIIKKYTKVEDIEIEPVKTKAYGKVKLENSARLFDNLEVLSSPVENVVPLAMEYLNQDYGYTLYESVVEDFVGQVNIHIEGLRDRALVFVNEEYMGTLYRNDKKDYVEVNIKEKNSKLQIFVENMGRINYGPLVGELKGITGNVRIDHQVQFHWTMYPLPLKDISKVHYKKVSDEEKTPKFFKGQFDVEEARDTFLLMDGWKKGVVLINGFNVGRYFEVGPQRTLYVPAPLLKEGKNEIVIFELEGTTEAAVEFIDKPILG